jgi:hypothetical protein
MSNVPDWRPSRRRWSPGDVPTDSYTKSYYTITKRKSDVQTLAGSDGAV